MLGASAIGAASVLGASAIGAASVLGASAIGAASVLGASATGDSTSGITSNSLSLVRILRRSLIRADFPERSLR